MGAMLTTGDVYEMAISQTYLAQRIINVLHFKCLVNISGAQAAFQTLADDCKEIFRTRQSQNLSYLSWRATQVAGTGVTYSTTTCKRSGGDTYEGLFTGGLVGGDTNIQPGQSYVGLVVALKTGLAGRTHRGMIYAGGYDIATYQFSNRNHWDATFLNNVATDLAAFYGKYGVPSGTNPNFGWVVFSRITASGCKYQQTASGPKLLPFAPPDAAGSKSDVKTVTPRLLSSPMNRRKEGVGV